MFYSQKFHFHCVIIYLQHKTQTKQTAGLPHHEYLGTIIGKILLRSFPVTYVAMVTSYQDDHFSKKINQEGSKCQEYRTKQCIVDQNAASKMSKN